MDDDEEDDDDDDDDHDHDDSNHEDDASIYSTVRTMYSRSTWCYSSNSKFFLYINNTSSYHIIHTYNHHTKLS